MLHRVSDEAKGDLVAIQEYGSAHYGEVAADRYLASLTEAFVRIAEWPLASRIRDEVKPAIRMATHKAHNIFYDVGGEIVEIVRAMHHSADWQNEL
jgi:toxin ParE1/3/4